MMWVYRALCVAGPLLYTYFAYFFFHQRVKVKYILYSGTTTRFEELKGERQPAKVKEGGM